VSLIATAFVFGIVFNATPGPVFAETVRRGVRGGFRAAIAVQFGSLIGDALWAVVGLIGAGLLFKLASLKVPLAIGSVLYLLWLARSAWRSSREDFSVGESPDAPDHRASFRSGIVLSITNPQNIAYWAAIASALGSIGVTNPTVNDNLLFFGTFMLSSMIWVFVFAALVDRVFRVAGARWARMTYGACAVLFVVLALSLVRGLWLEVRRAEQPVSELRKFGSLSE